MAENQRGKAAYFCNVLHCSLRVGGKLYFCVIKNYCLDDVDFF